MAGVLAICGVSRAEIAKWALRQADRHRFLDLVRAAHGFPVGGAEKEGDARCAERLQTVQDGYGEPMP
jgi:hypothetical protein